MLTRCLSDGAILRTLKVQQREILRSRVLEILHIGSYILNRQKRPDFAPQICQGVSIGFQSFLRLLGAEGRVLERYQCRSTRIIDCRLLSPTHGVFPASAAFILALFIPRFLVSPLQKGGPIGIAIDGGRGRSCGPGIVWIPSHHAQTAVETAQN